MGGCGSAPEKAPPIPTLADGSQEFVLQGFSFSSDVQVSTKDKEKWMYIDNKSGWFSEHAHFELQTLETKESPERRTLASCKIESCDTECKKDVEMDGDSDDSDFSFDDLFDFDDDDECKVKLKWKLKREAKFFDAEGNEFAKLKFKGKGKAKAEATRENDDAPIHVSASNKVKKAFFKLYWEAHHGDGEEFIGVDFENGHWNQWDRKFTTKLFEADYDAKWGTDTVTIKTNDGCEPIHSMLVGFAISYFFHPSRFHDNMTNQAASTARHYLIREG